MAIVIRYKPKDLPRLHPKDEGICFYCKKYTSRCKCYEIVSGSPKRDKSKPMTYSDRLREGFRYHRAGR